MCACVKGLAGRPAHAFMSHWHEPASTCVNSSALLLMLVCAGLLYSLRETNYRQACACIVNSMPWTGVILRTSQEASIEHAHLLGVLVDWSGLTSRRRADWQLTG